MMIIIINIIIIIQSLPFSKAVYKSRNNLIFSQILV